MWSCFTSHLHSVLTVPTRLLMDAFRGDEFCLEKRLQNRSRQFYARHLLITKLLKMSMEKFGTKPGTKSSKIDLQHHPVSGPKLICTWRRRNLTSCSIVKRDLSSRLEKSPSFEQNFPAKMHWIHQYTKQVGIRLESTGIIYVSKPPRHLVTPRSSLPQNGDGKGLVWWPKG